MGSYITYTGSTDIPEEKRDEFTGRMLYLLQQGGMMQYHPITIKEQKLILLQPMAIRSGRIIADYNYYEDEPWEDICYDCNTCQLLSYKVGHSEYADVVAAAYTLYAMYTDHPGIALHNGYVRYGTYPIGWLNHLFHTQWTAQHLTDPWTALEMLHDTGLRGVDLKKSTEYLLHIVDAWPNESMAITVAILYGSEVLLESLAPREGERPFQICRDILSIRDAIKTIRANNEDISLDTMLLLAMSTGDKIPAKYKDGIDGLYCKYLVETHITYVQLSVVLIAESYGVDFWDVWQKAKEYDRLQEKWAIDQLPAPKAVPIEPISTSDYLDQPDEDLYWDLERDIDPEDYPRISDDDRLLYWVDDDTTPAIKEWTDELQKQYADKLSKQTQCPMDATEAMDMWIQALKDADDIFGAIYCLEEPFYDFFAHASDLKYQAAITMLRDLVATNKPKEQAIREQFLGYYCAYEIPKQYMRNKYRMEVKRFIAILCNPVLRNKLFGF